MSKNTTYIIGLMSGTSLDGLDLACVSFHAKNNIIEWDWIATDCIAYDNAWKDQLKNAHLLSSADLMALDVAYGKFLGEQVNTFILKYGLSDIEAIASHGHTVFHQPENGYTLQIGHGAHLHATTQLKVICDFRSQDVALGGQGAPLVPIGDQLLFSEYDACVNMGGFANISFQDKEQNRIAFDICPVNYVLNYYAAHLGLPYDAEGRIASKGNIIPELISTLNTIAYYTELGPKSLGREWVEKNVFSVIKNDEHTSQDILASFTTHVAMQIAEVINQNELNRVLFTGGGALNHYLMQNIGEQTEANIIIADETLLHYKEALIFALLGYLRLKKKTNVLNSVTGAIKNSSSGVIYN